MAWNDCILSTPGSLARIESEVNGLAGAYNRPCYVGDGAATLTFPSAVASIVWYDEQERGTELKLTGAWTLPEANVCHIEGKNSAGDDIASYPCDEGVQLISRDVSGNGNHAALSTAAVHGTCEVTGNWLEKIALARTMLEARLENILSARGIRVNESVGEVLLNVITNPRVFTLAADYLALHLIYADLAADMGKELWFRKAEYYQKQYEANLTAALRRVNLDFTMDGVPEHYRSGLFAAGRITR